MTITLYDHWAIFGGFATRTAVTVSAGRRRKLSPPPRALPGANEALAPLMEEDVESARLQAGLEYRAPFDDPAATTEITSRLNSAFQGYANAAAFRQVRPRARECQDWCTDLTLATRELRDGLREGGDSGAFDHSSFEAAAILRRGLAPFLTSTCRDDLIQLRKSFQQALPDHFAFNMASTAPADVECLHLILARLLPSLEALSLLAARAADKWGSTVNKGTTPDEASRYLFLILVQEYKVLFGDWPQTTWTSASHRWFFNIIDTAGRRTAAGEAAATVDRSTGGHQRPIRRSPFLIALANEIAPKKLHSGYRQAALEKRIRLAIAAASETAEGLSTFQASDAASVRG